MNKSASPNHQWVWTELTESLRGVKYPDTETRVNGQPIFERLRQSCPYTWVEKGYVREAPIEGQITMF